MVKKRLIRIFLSEWRNLCGCAIFLVLTGISILSGSSGNTRCNALAWSYGARIHSSRSSSVARITGMTFGWIWAVSHLCREKALW